MEVLCSIPSALVLAPLPAARILWEAEDEVVWSRAMAGTEAMSERNVYAVNRRGNLVEVDAGRITCTDDWLPLDTDVQSPVVEWKDWFAEADAFGGLVLMTATLLKP
jgi:hypothetical protein